MRTEYFNGAPIDLTHNGCDGCTPVSVNGTLCHERGCAYAWKDSVQSCDFCGENLNHRMQGAYGSEHGPGYCAP